jgi:acetyl-CoA C-acetyltransferase
MDCTPVVVAARRTAIATSGRAFATLTASDLASPVLQAVIADVLRAGDRIDDIVLGVARSPGGNPARVASLTAGLDPTVPGMTVDRQCGSGLAAIQVAADRVRAGSATIVLAGGSESASTAPAGRARFAPEVIGDPDMGPAAEDLARAHGIARERQDAYAYRSHARALAADFSAELVEVAGLQQDMRPRAVKSEVLARMPAAFVPGGTVTAGNSCGISDGAAVVAIVPEWWRAERGLPGLAILGSSAIGVDPRLPGIGPAPAIEQVLRTCGLDLVQIDVLEITEAFAAQVLAVTDALSLDALGADATRICPQGGAIAMGHPWGASGAILMVRLFSQLVRDPIARDQVMRDADLGSGPRLGIASCAVGGGMGLATVVERVP